MNGIGSQAAAVLLQRAPRIVVCPTAIYKAPMYIAYDYVCPHCPKEDQGPQLVYLPQASADTRHSDPVPRVYTRFYYDHRYQVYAVNAYDLPPQQSRARICSFWCHHDIDSSPPIQRNWYYGQWGNPIRGVLQDDGTEAFTDPTTGHTIISPPPAGFTIHPEARGPADDIFESTSTIKSLQSEASIATPSLGGGSIRSRSSFGFPMTPRTTYNTPATYRLPTILHTQDHHGMNPGELEELRNAGAIVLGGVTGNETTPIRDINGGRVRGGGTETPTPRRVTGALAANMNPPPGPRVGGPGRNRGRGHGRGGRATRIWNWHN